MPKHDRALIDTSVVIDLDIIDPDRLPNEFAMSAVTLAELAAGPLATDDLKQRVLRQDRLQRAESTIMTISLDRNAARAYARVYAANLAAGRRSRIKFADYLIAATAVASNLALYTRNAADFAYLDEILEVVEV